MERTMENILLIIFCHLIGDHVLQLDHIAHTKGKSWYHLLVHCFLYCVPFYAVYGYDWKLCVMLASHIIVDALKARYNKINYAADQILHYIIGFALYALLK
jgi:hypothetical protein